MVVCVDNKYGCRC